MRQKLQSTLLIHCSLKNVEVILYLHFHIILCYIEHQCYSILNHPKFDCLFKSLDWPTEKTTTSKLHIAGPLWGESTGDLQKVSNAERVAMSWYHGYDFQQLWSVQCWNDYIKMQTDLYFSSQQLITLRLMSTSIWYVVVSVSFEMRCGMKQLRSKEKYH